MFEPVVILEAFFGVMLGWIALVCLNEKVFTSLYLASQRSSWVIDQRL